MIYQVTYDDILLAYCEAMRVPDAKPYIKSEHSIRSAIARPYASFGGKNVYPTLHHKAAALLHGVAKAHGFHDGNKRAAVLITMIMIRLSGYDLPPVSIDFLDKIVVRLVEGSMSQEAAATWFHIVTE